MIRDNFVPVKPKKGENLVSTKLSNPKGFEISLNLFLVFSSLSLSGLIYIL